MKKKVALAVLTALLVFVLASCPKKYNKNITKDDFSYTCTITDTLITVEVTPNVDIKAFSFEVFMYRSANVFHQYHENVELDFAKKGVVLKYSYGKDIIDKYTYGWSVFDKLDITNFHGKKK